MIDDDFESAVGAYRKELLVHCYRMLGSVHEAEDLVQETMLRAWRAWDRYDERRASVRTWLYKIATNACLTALKGRARRPLPSMVGGPEPGEAEFPLAPALDVPWLQPFPDALLDDPASRVARRGSLRLALIAAMQVLPPKQRAVLILRDVLEFSAAETAELLETSAAAVNSALQRARAGLSGVAVTEEEVAEPDDAAVNDLLDRYVRSFETADVGALVTLLTDDAALEMPPVPHWYRGRHSYGLFMVRLFEWRGTGWRMVRTTANGQPALVAYLLSDGVYRLHTLQVLTVEGGRVARNVVFTDARVFSAFGLAPTLPGP
ncbi:sigma-70 family RNA polymerase sigma factor [Actinomadura chibensis]|uniref:RNA polymerase sigma factor n=1 Tax=Actinomadura chibensis TaxID=392828 RepID=A0A5D0NYV8_9ACTN|nr:sigma-70 family RNA polymerase sigma factor [Actinomadura chibensis]TYB49348.1 sigma-70 family RNA polymerase sigma factor [Actinomadura chibensis]